METLHIILIVAGIALVIFLLWYFLFRKPKSGELIRLPLQLLGYKNIPGVPFSLEATAESAVKLAGRALQTKQALNGLQRKFTIQGHTANARSFLFGEKEQEEHEAARQSIIYEMAESDHKEFLDESVLKERLKEPSPLEARAEAGKLTQLFMNSPEQFTLSWTEFSQVYQNAKSKTDYFSNSLKTDANGAKAATETFWPLIANHGMAFNLLIPKKMPEQESGPLAGKTLFQIDMRFFEQFESTSSNGFERFTPGVIVDLYQDAETLNLLPYRIQVFKNRGAESQTYEYGPAAGNDTSNSMWVYAIQAAKAAVTVWGIWLGHVYHWHIVTAALQMTMFNTLEENSDVRTLLDPMSNYLIGFDNFLLLAFEHIAPPTSFKSGLDFIGLQDAFANGRSYHDDDPVPTLKRLGITEADFTSPGSSEKWDKYPIVRYLLDLWNATEDYVTIYVNQVWPNDAAVNNDAPLHQWLDASRDPKNGNVMGIPDMKGKGAQQQLIDFLTSYIYRITAHGSSRMNTAANPVLSFVANYPPCLQNSSLNPPKHVLSQEELLQFLPNTGTIGNMVTFLFTFVFSAPYESFIPVEGIEEDLFFDDKTLNDALIQFRRKVEEVLKVYDSQDPWIHQWPRNIET